MSEGADRKKGAATFWKWVGGVSALLSLLFALQQFTSMLSDVGERQRRIVELEQVARQQLDSADYPGAWSSYDEALKAADAGGKLAKMTGQLDAERRRLREGQEDLAMRWLENVRLPEGKRFDDVIGPIVAVIHRGAAGAEGARKADLLAHLGWADFLRWRDGNRALRPELKYQEALAIDPGNPYAHAYWGHWILWRREGRAEGLRHFEAAFAAKRAHALVRELQLAALNNLTLDGQGAYLAAVADMRKKGEEIDARTRSRVNAIYWTTCARRPDAERQAELLASLPAAEQLALLDALFGPGHEFHQTLSACREWLRKAAGA